MDGLVPLPFRRVGIDGVGGHHPAGGVDGRHLDAGADAGIEPEDGVVTSGRGQQQILEVGGEDLDGRRFRRLAQAHLQVQVEAREELDLPGPAHHLRQPVVGSAAAVFDAEAGGDARFAVGGRGLVFVDDQLQRQHPFVLAAEERQGAVGGDLRNGLLVLEVVLEARRLGARFAQQAGAQDALSPEPFAQFTRQLGILGEALHEDLLGALQRGLGVRHPLPGVHVTGSGGLWIERRVLQQGIGQRLQSGLAGDLRLGAPLGLVGEVEILQSRLGVRHQNGLLQFRGELLLPGDGLENGGAPLFQLAQVVKPLLQGTQLGIVQAAGDLLAVAGDEGNRGAVVQQLYGGFHLAGACTEFLGDTLFDLHGVPGVVRLSGVGILPEVSGEPPAIRDAGGLDKHQRIRHAGAGFERSGSDVPLRTPEDVGHAPLCPTYGAARAAVFLLQPKQGI